MSKRALLVEPYDAIADMIADLLAKLDYEVKVMTSGAVDEKCLRQGAYDLVLINLDQNRSEWHDYGLKLAEVASSIGVP
jgi:DNA-binding response OmpR family regulator